MPALPPMSIPFKAVMAFAQAELRIKQADLMSSLTPEGASALANAQVLPYIALPSGAGAMLARIVGGLGGGAAGALTGGALGGAGGWTAGQLINALRGQARTPAEQKQRDELPATLGWAGMGGGLGAGLVRGGVAGAK